MKVFLSVGQTYSEAQEKFVQEFERFLVQRECKRLTVGRGSLGAKQPILQARDLMEEADAVVVIAFTRLHVEKAVEMPGGPKEKVLMDIRYPTIWNQLEASMAFGLKLPLLVILEEGVHQEAMLKDRLEFRVWTTALDPGFINSEEFKGVFDDFKKIATTRTRKAPEVNDPKVGRRDVGSMTIAQLFGDLRPDQVWKVGAAIITLLFAMASAGYWVGTRSGPTDPVKAPTVQQP